MAGKDTKFSWAHGTSTEMLRRQVGASSYVLQMKLEGLGTE